MKLWKGITAAALVLAVAPIVGVTTANQAEAATAVTAAAASCENTDGSYNGGVCKNDGLLRPVLKNEANPSFPASLPGDRVKVTLTRDTPKYPHPVFYVQLGETRLNHAQATASLEASMDRAYEQCVGPQGQSAAYCAGYYKNIPAIPYFEVLPASEMFPKLTFETTWQGFLDNTKTVYNDKTSSQVVAERIN